EQGAFSNGGKFGRSANELHRVSAALELPEEIGAGNSLFFQEKCGVDLPSIGKPLDQGRVTRAESADEILVRVEPLLRVKLSPALEDSWDIRFLAERNAHNAKQVDLLMRNNTPLE